MRTATGTNVWTTANKNTGTSSRQGDLNDPSQFVCLHSEARLARWAEAGKPTMFRA